MLNHIRHILGVRRPPEVPGVDACRISTGVRGFPFIFRCRTVSAFANEIVRSSTAQGSISINHATIGPRQAIITFILQSLSDKGFMLSQQGVDEFQRVAISPPAFPVLSAPTSGKYGVSTYRARRSHKGERSTSHSHIKGSFG